MSEYTETQLIGKISFKPSHQQTTVQYGFTIDSTTLTDFSRGNSSYSFSVNLIEGGRNKTAAAKNVYRPLKIKLWKLELKPVRKSVQLQRKLLIKLKVQQEEWERNPVSEWKIPAGDIIVEFPLEERITSYEHYDVKTPPRSPKSPRESPMTSPFGSRVGSPSSPQSPKSTQNHNLMTDASFESPNPTPVSSPMASPSPRPRMLVHSKRSSVLMYRSVQAENSEDLASNGVDAEESVNLSNPPVDFGRQLPKVDASAQTLIVAIQKRTLNAATKKHRLSTTNIAKNLLAENTSSVVKNLFPEASNEAPTIVSPNGSDLAQKRRSFVQQTNQLKPLNLSTTNFRKSREIRRRTTNMKIISVSDNNSDIDEGTPTSPNPNDDSQSSFGVSTTRSQVSGTDSQQSRNSDTIPKWAQRALSPASTPATMKKERFVDRNDPTSYAYIMYFIQGAHEECFTSFKKFCQCILYVGAGSQECSPFTAHFSTLLDGSQYSLTERLFRMEQHNSRVPPDRAHERFRVFLLQLPTSDYLNEEWVMAHLRQASMLAALTSSLEGVWKKPLKHLNTFKTSPTNDNTSIIMNETIGVEFNKVLRYERIQFGLNLLKITYVRAQNEAIELDLSDVKLIEMGKRRSGGFGGNNTIPSVGETIRIVDTKRYRLYFSKSDEEWLQLFPDDIKTRGSLTM